MRRALGAWTPSTLAIVILAIHFVPVGLSGAQERSEPQGSFHIYGSLMPPQDESQFPQSVLVTLRSLDGSIFRTTPARGRAFQFEGIAPLDYVILIESEGRQPVEVGLPAGSFRNGNAYVSIALGSRVSEHPRPALPSGQTVEVRTLAIPSKALREFQMGAKDITRGRLDNALKHLERAVELHPPFFEAFNKIGAVFLRKGQFPEAETAFLRAIALQPDSFSSLKGLAFVYLATGRADDAVALLSKACTLNAVDAETQGVLGGVLYHTGKYGEAEGPLKRALQMDPRQFRAFFLLGHVYYKLGRHKESLQAFREFLRTNRGMDPRDVQAIVSELEQKSR